MVNGIILYQSKYGATQKYAQWLVDATSFHLIKTSEANIAKIKTYDKIILCGGIYASGIAGLQFLRKNYNQLKSKKMAVFCVGASPYEPQAFKEIKTHNLKKDLEHIPLFYGRGAWDEELMSFKDRMLCKMLQKSIAKKDPSTYAPWMEALMSATGKKCDWTDINYLLPLIQYIQE